ncbi:hypothetical protein PG989_003301 [Apiospora arundinis]
MDSPSKASTIISTFAHSYSWAAVFLLAVGIPAFSATTTLRRRNSYWTRHWIGAVATFLFFFIVFTVLPLVGVGVAAWVLWTISFKLVQLLLHWPGTMLVGVTTGDWTEYHRTKRGIQGSILDGPSLGLYQQVDEDNDGGHDGARLRQQLPTTETSRLNLVHCGRLTTPGPQEAVFTVIHFRWAFWSSLKGVSKVKATPVPRQENSHNDKNNNAAMETAQRTPAAYAINAAPARPDTPSPAADRDLELGLPAADPHPSCPRPPDMDITDPHSWDPDSTPAPSYHSNIDLYPDAPLPQYEQIKSGEGLSV